MSLFTTFLARLGYAIEPAGGVVFFLLWIMAETGRLHTAAEVAVLALLAFGVAVSRLLPRVALSVVAATILLEVVGVLPPPDSTTWPVYLGILIVAFVVARHAGGRIPLAALALGVPLALATSALMVIPSYDHGFGWTSWVGSGTTVATVSDAAVKLLLVGLGLYAGAWFAGTAVRLNVVHLRSAMLLRHTAADLTVAEVELQVVRERDRIAQDVHDVLAHSLAVVIAQADGARFASQSAGGTPATGAEGALFAISDAARGALVDVRTLVEALREEHGASPQPDYSDVAPLVARVTAAGLPVTAEHFGTPHPMTPAQQLAVYRIVQEGLTNALRHAGRRAVATMSFDWRGPGLALSITTTGGRPVEPDGAAGTPTPTAAAQPGHGIRGMKERARLAGGWLTAGATDGDRNDFLVTAYIPTGDAPPGGNAMVTRLPSAGGPTASPAT